MTNIARCLAHALAVLVLVCAGVTHARAQGMYYKEIVKDGRIYVFNNAEEAERFEKTGELGKAITRPGAGPNGETVIADSERALELFFFKHGISEPVPQPPPPPPPPPAWRISGLVFGDYYYFADHHIDTTTTTPTGTLPQWKNQQGFWFRRLYFTYDHDLGSKITTRFRLEANSNGKLQGGNLNPYVKDAYVRWTYHGKHMAYLGIWGSATFYWLENFWGLRHIEKTPADLYRFDSSRDFGVSFEGPIGTAPLTYMAQFGNGSGNGSETDPDKTVRIEVRYDANPGFAVEGFYGRFWRPANKDEDIYQAFGGYRGKRGRGGLQYMRRSIDSGSTTEDTNVDMTSVFGTFDVVPKKGGVYARVDWLSGNNQKDPDSGVPGVDGIDYLPIDPRFDFTFLVTGFEWYIHPNWRVGPNVEWIKYGSGPPGISINDDVALRATFYWSW
jgi:hypothetical protein